MSLVTPTRAERRLLSLLVGEDCALRLFVNDHTPSREDAPEDLVELRGRFGYRAKTLSVDLWSVVEGSEGEPSFAAYEKQVFEFNSVPIDPIYGYYVQTIADGVVLWAERFPDGPYVIKIAGGRVNIWPRIELSPGQ